MRKQLNDRRADRRFRLPWLARPSREFLEAETVGAAVLLLAAVAALAFVNLGGGADYEALWGRQLKLGPGSASITEDLRHWVNEGLMAIFFLVVGMEIKRELVAGELRSPRRAALPVIAALGGMLTPAAIYMAFNSGTTEFRGWGIPMATDIAFAVGVLSLFRGLPLALRTFVLTLAVVDDLGAIAVIAVFYSEGIEPAWLLGAAALVVVGLVLLLKGVTWPAAYLGLGLVLWILIHESGVHATVAGVILAMVIPARLGDDSPVLHESTPSLLARLEHSIHPLSSFVIVPLFAFANAGVALSAGGLADATGTRVFLGILLGLVLGKMVGITVFTWAATRLNLGHLHPSLHLGHVAAAATVAGIGFTVSLFMADLAFATPEAIETAKLSIISASLLAGALGCIALLCVGRARRSA
ncbi:MAG: Na+/H+ antiporter NhaA [Dehalococcoidia bacterium]